MASTPSNNFDFQNFYSATLTSDITSGALTIPLSSAPTPTEGVLVINPDAANPEVIFYTSKGASSVTCPADGRGWDSSTAQSWLQGTTVIMAPVGYMFRMLKTGSLYDSYRTGWTNLGYTPATVTYNGNRSYDEVYSGVDLTGTVSPGMRLRTSRTVAAPTNMGGLLNGSTQYFTKATPSGTLGTVTDNFTIMAWVQPTSYADGDIACRADAAVNNAIEFRMDSSGRVLCTVFNGGVANFRAVTTYQSLPLNKRTHVAASWASGTVVIYFDGISVPVQAATTGGTAPTTAGTGGDFSIGRRGASGTFFFPGYISGVGVFNAVLSAATIRSYIPQVLSGSETNCIGAWSLNNVLTDSNAAGNNLSAGGSASFTAISPYASDASNVAGGTYDYAIVQKATYSGGNTTLTVQVPEGNTIPTSGGVSAVAYSSVKAPFGMPVDTGRWSISTLILSSIATSGTTSATIYNPGGINLNIPTGVWRLSAELEITVTSNANPYSINSAISTSPSAHTQSLAKFSVRSQVNQANTSNIHYMSVSRSDNISLSTATPHYILLINSSAFTAMTIGGFVSTTIPECSHLTAIPSNL